MSKPLTPTQRLVLKNLSSGKPMWSGISTINQGAGIPAVAEALRRKGLIDRNNELTAAGKAAAEKANQ